MSGIKNLLCRFDDLTYRHLADNDIYLHLGQQICLNLNTAVIFRLALLRAASEHVRNGHARNTNIHHSVLESLKSRFLTNDLDLCELRRTIFKSRNLLYGDRLCHRHLSANGNGTLISVIKTFNCGNEICVSTGQAVLGAVKSLDLLLGAHAQTNRLLDDEEGNRHRDGGPCENRKNAYRLLTEKHCTSRIKQSVKTCGSLGICQKSYCKRSPNTVNQMNTNGTDGIVDMQLQVKKLNSHYNKDTRYDTNNRSTDRIQRITARCNAYKSCQGSIETHRNVGLAVLDPSKDHRRAGRNCGGNGCGKEDGCQRGSIPCCRAVEAVPSKPKDKATKRAKRDRVTGNRVYLCSLSRLILNIFAKTGTNHNCTDQCGQASNRVDGSGTREIVEAPLRKPTLRIPDPACLNRINDKRDHTGINTIRNKFCSLCHSPRNNGCGGSTEHKVKYKARSIFLDKSTKIGKDIEIRYSDETKNVILSHHQSEAQQNEHNRSDAEVHQVLHNDVTCILSSGKACFNHCKSCLHKEYKRCSNQKPHTEHLGRYGFLYKFHDACSIHINHLLNVNALFISRRTKVLHKSGTASIFRRSSSQPRRMPREAHSLRQGLHHESFRILPRYSLPP